MATVTADATTSTEAQTRPLIIARVLRELRMGETATTTGNGSSTTVVSTRYANSQINTDDYVNCWIRITSGTRIGEICSVSSLNTSTGTFTVATLTGAPGTGVTFEVHRFLHPQIVLDHLDYLLANEHWSLCRSVLSEVPDSDMEASGTSLWSNSNATLTKGSTESTGIYLNGEQYLDIEASADNGYAKSTTLNVVSGQAFHASSLVRAESAATPATITFSVYDETNSATIASATWAKATLARLWLNGAIPSTCDSVSLRYTIAENGRTGLADECVFYNPNDSDIVLPTWVKQGAQVVSIHRLTPRNTIGTDAYDPAMIGERDDRWDLVDSPFGNNRLRAQARYGGLTRPLYIVGKRNETAFSSDTEVKRIDLPWVAAVLTYELCRILLDSSAQIDADFYRARLSQYEEMARKARVKQEVSFRDVYSNSSSPWTPAIGGAVRSRFSRFSGG